MVRGIFNPKPFSLFAKSSILDVWHGSEYVSALKKNIFLADLIKFGVVEFDHQALKGKTTDSVWLFRKFNKLFLISGHGVKNDLKILFTFIFEYLFHSIFWAIMVSRKLLFSVINFGITFSNISDKQTTNWKFFLKILRFVYEILKLLIFYGIVCIF